MGNCTSHPHHEPQVHFDTVDGMATVKAFAGIRQVPREKERREREMRTIGTVHDVSWARGFQTMLPTCSHR